MGKYVGIITDMENIPRGVIGAESYGEDPPKDRIELALKEEYCAESVEVVDVEYHSYNSNYVIKVMMTHDGEEPQEHEFNYQTSVIY